MIRKLSSVYVLAHSGFVSSFPMADSQLILELLVLQRRGGFDGRKKAGYSLEKRVYSILCTEKSNFLRSQKSSTERS